MEFALVLVVAVPLLFGTVAMGLTIGFAEQSIQITRDIGHMYGLGTDFTDSGNQAIAASLAPSFSLTSSGTMVLIFSKISTLYTADCSAGAVNASPSGTKQVFIQRIVLGNAALRTSTFGTPNSAYVSAATGNISSTNYCTQTSTLATNFPAAITQADGDVANIVEGYFTMPNLNFLAPVTPGQGTTLGGIYAQTIF